MFGFGCVVTSHGFSVGHPRAEGPVGQKSDQLLRCEVVQSRDFAPSRPGNHVFQRLRCQRTFDRSKTFFADQERSWVQLQLLRVDSLVQEQHQVRSQALLQRKRRAVLGNVKGKFSLRRSETKVNGKFGWPGVFLFLKNGKSRGICKQSENNSFLNKKNLRWTNSRK